MVRQGQLLCKVSDSQLSLMSRKLNFDVNVDGRTNERTDGRTNERTDGRKFELLLLIAGCDKNDRPESPTLQIIGLWRRSFRFLLFIALVDILDMRHRLFMQT